MYLDDLNTDLNIDPQPQQEEKQNQDLDLKSPAPIALKAIIRSAPNSNSLHNSKFYMKMIASKLFIAINYMKNGTRLLLLGIISGQFTQDTHLQE
jgi:hypothetical protein